MDSKLDIVHRLLDEGKKFTFSNFCLPNSFYPGQYAGDDTPEWSAFKIRVNNIVKDIVAEDSPAMTLVDIGITVLTEGNGPDNFNVAKANLIKALETVAETMENDIYGELKKDKSSAKSAALSNKVFIVHGHDNSLKTDVERFIHELGLIPVVLHREADQGATIIEKFEKHSDVGYAFILLTPDEISYTIDQASLIETERKIEYRARPNVIFEFGYFVGKLGRNRVCCLYKGNVTVPSDLSGLIYKKIEESIDPQAYSIIKELKAAGYNISM